MKHFRNTTKGHVVLMGKNTMLSLKEKPLPERVNLVWDTREKSVLSKQQKEVGFVPCNEEYLEALLENGVDVYVIGGSYIYNLFWNRADEIIETEVYYHYEDADCFVPEIDTDKYGYFELDKWESKDFDQLSKRDVPFSVTRWIKKEELFNF